jgi:surface antigen
MRRATQFAIILLLPSLMAACGPGNKQGTGTIVGATAGAVAGAAIGGPSNRVGGAAIGAVAGGIIGNVIGRDMDERDRQMAAAAEYRALEYGQSGAPVAWDNPQSQHRGQIVPGKPYVQAGLNCRTYTHTIYISGQPQTARGTACRQPDGTWKTVG